MSNVEAVKDVLVSNNGMIKEGMKVSESNKSPEAMSVFNFADKDGNGVISKAEAERYMAPILFSCDEGETVLKPEVTENYKPCKHAVEIYAGQKIEDVQPKGRELYTLVDIDHKNKISKEEMEMIYDAVNKSSQYKTQQNNKSAMAEGLFASGGLIGIVGGLFTALATDGLIANLKTVLTKNPHLKWGIDASFNVHNAKVSIKELLTKSLPIGLTALVGGGILLYLGYKAYKASKEAPLDGNSHPYLKAKFGTK